MERNRAREEAKRRMTMTRTIDQSLLEGLNEEQKEEDSDVYLD